ncbi:MAG: cytochrome-c oxidase, cbb3-type subunit III [Hyphomicrobium sp.]|nr:cytochrome-c oxidase, cbb3-type subunit III [Hyphomicrobium sp.]
MSAERHIDDVTGIETTGHVWDEDLRELNKPLPKWWLYTFYACIVWAIGYWVLYPAFPLSNDYTRGILGYSQRAVVSADVAAGKAAQSEMRALLDKTPLEDVAKNADLKRFATVGGAAAFATNCAPCHGRGAQGFAGYPNLNDDDWLWGGKISDVQFTILHGIRQGTADSRAMDMPRFGIDGALTPEQIADAAEFVQSLSGHSTDKDAAARGQTIFAEQCAACHGETGKGNQEMGAPNLSDAIWLYGGEKAAIMESIRTGRGGKMPAWGARLDPTTIKSLAVYVHGLGGGVK